MFKHINMLLKQIGNELKGGKIFQKQIEANVKKKLRKGENFEANL